MQTVIASFIVLACALYAAWTLAPAAARRPLAGALLRAGLPLPAGWVRRLERATRPTSGCGCDGCDRAPPKAAQRPTAAAGGVPPGSAPATANATSQVVHFHRRSPR